jgi:tetratricopeptide (TPR) repeat protein
MADADKLFEEATVHTMAGEHEEAVEIYRKALEAEEDHVDSWIGLAGALYTLEKYEEARDAARELLSHRPKFPDAWFVIGQSEVELKNYEEATMAFGRALEQKEDLQGRFKDYWEGMEKKHPYRKDSGAKDLAKKYIQEKK